MRILSVNLGFAKKKKEIQYGGLLPAATHLLKKYLQCDPSVVFLPHVTQSRQRALRSVRHALNAIETVEEYLVQLSLSTYYK